MMVATHHLVLLFPFKAEPLKTPPLAFTNARRRRQYEQLRNLAGARGAAN